MLIYFMNLMRVDQFSLENVDYAIKFYDTL